MNQNTFESLNELSKILVKAFITDANLGHTTRPQVEALRARTKYPTDIELVKGMIRTDMRCIRPAVRQYGWNGNLDNVMKRTEHFNYLANAVMSGIKKTAWRDQAFKQKYNHLFGVKNRVHAAKPVMQMELGI